MGRPREFDREEKLDRAMRLFWKRGYDGVSLQNLLDELEINNSSFYHAFESKEALFSEVLDYYFKKVGAFRVAPLFEEGKSARERLENYFGRLVQLNMSPKNPDGCLIASSAAIAPGTNPAVAKRITEVVRETKTRIENALVNVLTAGQQRREISPEIDAKSLAKLLVTIVFGLNLLARATKSRAEMEEVVRRAIEMCC
jgi:AcrR family transcriptional regulator